MSELNFIATTTFGLEASVKREVTKLNFKNIKVSDGRVDFTGDISCIPKANLWLRSADRLLLVLGEFEALTFDELFEKTKALPWDEWITKNGKFTVTGKSIKSKLFSVPDCQSIVKKAVVEKMKTKYHTDFFEETEEEYTIQVALLKDVATLTIDTTGSGLHKRGYRETSVIAPLKETLAAAMIELSYWKKDRHLLDPLCGSGTIPIEAALIGKNIAPGLKRTFVSEDWPVIGKNIWKTARHAADDSVDTTAKLDIVGSDYDYKAIEIAKENAKKAGVSDCIKFYNKDFKDVRLEKDYGIVITNPPYGERIGEVNEVEQLYYDMGRLFNSNLTWSVYVITSHEDFERIYKRDADKKRKLYNGRIKIDYYQFVGPRPVRNNNI